MSEIRIMSFNFAPKGWAQCNGQLLPINQNQALFSLLGTMYGGNGQTNFALPDFRGRVPIHFGSGFTEGQAGGQEAHTVTISELPAHNHFWQGSTTAATTADPAGAFFGDINTKAYGTVAALTTLSPASVSNVGGSQPHENRQPFLVLNFAIALQGIFPSQT